MKRRNTPGFAVVELLILVVVIAAIGFLGYTFYHNQKPTATSDNSSVETTTDVATTPEITSTDDLTKAEQTLDSMVIENESDDAQLDTELSAF